MGFMEEMGRILHGLPYVQKRVLLSATDADSIPKFVQMGKTQRLNYLMEEEQVLHRVEIYQVKSPEKDKLNTLRLLLCELGELSSIVFLNYRESVERVASYLNEQGFTISFFHG
jgi:superfamily II DNA/RNA helicase